MTANTFPQPCPKSDIPRNVVGEEVRDSYLVPDNSTESRHGRLSIDILAVMLFGLKGLLKGWWERGELMTNAVFVTAYESYGVRTCTQNVTKSICILTYRHTRSK